MITIVDYGMGNLGSIRNMFSRIGAESVIASTPDAVRRATKLVLPGVGSFDRAMTRLRELDLVPALNERALEARVPLLGICLGMQLLTRRSDEGTLPGLGWIDAETVRFDSIGDVSRLRVPHMGWNTIEVRQPNPILFDPEPDTRFYFVHSYAVRCRDEASTLATTRYGVEFASAVIGGNIMGTQFHPEKSHRFGMKVLGAFAAL